MEEAGPPEKPRREVELVTVNQPSSSPNVSYVNWYNHHIQNSTQVRAPESSFQSLVHSARALPSGQLIKHDAPRATITLTQHNTINPERN